MRMRKTIPTLIFATAALFVTSTAWAVHPTGREMERTKVIAHELEDAARRVHKAAEHYAHHYGYGQERALEALHELERRARHFHRQVERYYQDPYHTEADYEKLYYAYRRAYRAFRYLHAEEHVYDYFHDVQALMSELNRYYGGDRGYGYSDRHHRHDRYCDHDYPRRYRYPRWRW